MNNVNGEGSAVKSFVHINVLRTNFVFLMERTLCTQFEVQGHCSD